MPEPTTTTAEPAAAPAPATTPPAPPTDIQAGVGSALKLSPAAQQLKDAKGKPPVTAAPPVATPPAPGERRVLIDPESATPPAPAVVPKPGEPAAKPPETIPELPKDEKARIEAFQAQRRRIVELEKLIAESPDERDALKKQNDELLSIVERQNLEASPRFRAKFESAIQQKDAALKQIGKEWEVAEDVIEQVAQASTMKARSELLAAVDPDAKAMILAAAREVDTARAQKQSALAEHAKTKTVMQVEEDAMLTESRERLSDAALNIMRQKGVHFLTPVEGNQPWNEQVAQLETSIRKNIASRNPQEQSALIAMGTLVPFFERQAMTYKAERDALKKEIEARRGLSASPTPPAPGSAPADTTLKPMSTDGLVANILQSVRGQK